MGQASDSIVVARSQLPLASHCGLVHCTVAPGRKDMVVSLSRLENASLITPRKFINRTPNFHRIVMRSKKCVNGKEVPPGNLFADCGKRKRNLPGGAERLCEENWGWYRNGNQGLAGGALGGSS